MTSPSGPDDEWVDGHRAVPEVVVGATLHPRSQVSVPGGRRLLHEHVRKFVADQRLHAVAQVRDQDGGARCSRQDRAVLLVDQLDDAPVLGERDHVLVRRARTDQPSDEPKLSINGASNPSEIVARNSGVQVSLVLVMIIG